MDNTRHVNYGGNTRQLRFSGVYFVWIWYIVGTHMSDSPNVPFSTQSYIQYSI